MLLRDYDMITLLLESEQDNAKEIWIIQFKTMITLDYTAKVCHIF